MKNQWHVTRNDGHAEIQTVTYKKGKIKLDYLIFQNEIYTITLTIDGQTETYELPRDKQTGLNIINEIAKRINLSDDLKQEMLSYLPESPMTSIFHKPSKKSKRPEQATMEEATEIAACAYLTARL